MSFNLFRISHLIPLAIKVSLLLLIGNKGFEHDIRELPFFSTKFTDYDRVKEAMYFIERNEDPYQVEHIFQKPLLIYLFNILEKIPGAVFCIYLILDWILAEIISSAEFIHSKNKVESEREKGRHAIRLVYHFNPISFLAILTKWTSIFEFTFGLSSVYLFSQKKNTLGSLLLAVSIYLNPSMLILVVPIMCSYVQQEQKIEKLFKYLFLSSLVIVGLIFASFQLTGTFMFIQNAYIRTYSPNLFQPSCGLIWTLFSGLFTKFEKMYHLIFALLQISHSFPLFKIFSKGIVQNDYKMGLSGFISGTSLYVIYLHFPFITIFELALIGYLLFGGYEYIYEIKVIPFLFIVPPVMYGIASNLGKMWFFSHSANPNHIFFQMLVFYALLTILVTEQLKNFSFQKHNQEKKLKEEKQKEELAKDASTSQLSSENKKDQ